MEGFASLFRRIFKNLWDVFPGFAGAWRFSKRSAWLLPVVVPIELRANQFQSLVFPWLLVEIGREFRHQPFQAFVVAGRLRRIEAQRKFPDGFRLVVPIQLAEHRADAGEEMVAFHAVIQPQAMVVQGEWPWDGNPGRSFSGICPVSFGGSDKKQNRMHLQIPSDASCFFGSVAEA